jgi:hypothetical protein
MAVSLAPDRPQPADGRSPGRELNLVCSSVSLVATGGARRVTHVGLSFATEILADAQAYGREHGVIVRGQWREAGPGCDIVVEPIG